jgi:aminoglycoside 2''-phosphotransferase
MTDGFAADPNRYRRRLQDAAPDLAIDRFEYLGQGWDNILFLANGDLVVRFAKDPHAARQLVTESEILRLVAAPMPVKIPTPWHIDPSSTERDPALMTYPRIPGVALEDIELTDELVAAVAPVLADFLDALHSIPLSAIEQIDIPRFSAAAWVSHDHALYQRTRDALRDALDDAIFRRYDHWWSDYLADRANFEFVPCLVHGDLVPEHILIGQSPWRVSGVIDFGDAMWTDPALDLAGLPARLARPVVDRMRTLTGDRAFWSRREAYQWIAPLHAVAAGLERGSSELLRGGIDAIREWEPR